MKKRVALPLYVLLHSTHDVFFHRRFEQSLMKKSDNVLFQISVLRSDIIFEPDI